MSKNPRVGTCWRILLQEPTQRIVGGNYDLLEARRLQIAAWTRGGFEHGQVFDELVIVFAPDVPDVPDERTAVQHNSTTLHLEQMNGRDWHLAVGDRDFNIHVGKNGALELMQTQGPDVKDGR